LFSGFPEIYDDLGWINNIPPLTSILIYIPTNILQCIWKCQVKQL